VDDLGPGEQLANPAAAQHRVRDRRRVRLVEAKLHEFLEFL
jgi:hypothetical protein